MGKDTDVEWARHTFNLAWGCEEVGDDCDHCYAKTFDHRLGGDHWGRDEHGVQKPLKLNSDAYWGQPLAWDKAARAAGRRDGVFCSSMTDVMLEHPQMPALRARLWRLISLTPHLDWYLLTKRPNGFRRHLPWRPESSTAFSNVWLGVTVGRADYTWRLDELRRTPAWRRFCSYEPALGPVDFRPWLVGDGALDWIICGSESGAGARPADTAWYEDVRRQIDETGSKTAFFYKQHVESGRKVSLPLLGGRQWKEKPC